MASSSDSGPGAIRTAEGTVRLNERPEGERIDLVLVNAGDRPIQVGSHVHLPDANASLEFDRAAAHGFRLDLCCLRHRPTQLVHEHVRIIPEPM